MEIRLDAADVSLAGEIAADLSLFERNPVPIGIAIVPVGESDAVVALDAHSPRLRMKGEDAAVEIDAGERAGAFAEDVESTRDRR